MTEGFPEVPIGELARPVERPERPIPGRSYRQLGVRLWGHGAYEREVLDGSETRYARLSRVAAGDIVVNKIWARNGSVAVVPTSLEDCYVSGEFPTFQCLPDRLDPRWFHWITRARWFWDRCDIEARGTSGKNRIRPERFLTIPIPVPIIVEQRRIVTRIEAMASALANARRLREQARAGCEALGPAFLTKEFESLASAYPVRALKEVSLDISDGPHKTPTYVNAGVPFVTVKNMVSGTLDLSGVQHVTPEDHRVFSRRSRAEKGDVLYSKDGATRGRPCFVDTDEPFSFFVSVALIKPQRELLDGRYLCHLLNSGGIRERMHLQSRGDMIPHIVLSEIRKFPVPLPPLPEQRRVVACLDVLQDKVNALKALQEKTAAELDALLPSILDKAFRGEL